MRMVDKINDQSLIMGTYHVSLHCIHNIKSESTQQSVDKKKRNFFATLGLHVLSNSFQIHIAQAQGV